MTEPRRLLFDPTNANLTDEAQRLPPRMRDPRCRGACTSRDRPANDSPAKPAQERGTGRKLIYCTCCGHELRLIPKGVIQQVRPANLNPALEVGRYETFADDICGYDSVAVWDIKEIR